MKKYRNVLIFSAIVIVYFILGLVFKVEINCPIHEIFHVYCPGCGVTRMLIALFTGNIYQSFRYNPLLFIMFPFFIFFFIENIISIKKERKPLYLKISDKFWIMICILLIIYAILRNIFPILAPTTI